MALRLSTFSFKLAVVTCSTNSQVNMRRDSILTLKSIFLTSDSMRNSGQSSDSPTFRLNSRLSFSDTVVIISHNGRVIGSWLWAAITFKNHVQYFQLILYCTTLFISKQLTHFINLMNFQQVRIVTNHVVFKLDNHFL